MKSAAEKWQVTVVILSIVGCVTALAMHGKVDSGLVIGGLFSLATLLLGGGVAVHAATQAKKPPPKE